MGMYFILVDVNHFILLLSLLLFHLMDVTRMYVLEWVEGQERIANPV